MRLIQQQTASAAAGSRGVTVQASTLDGSFLVAIIAVGSDDTVTVSQLLDSQNNQWVLAESGFKAGANGRVEIWYCPGAAHIVELTATFTGGTAAGSIILAEFEGVRRARARVVDGTTDTSNTATTSPTSGSYTTTEDSSNYSHDEDLLVAAIAFEDTDSVSVTPTDWTALTSPTPPATNLKLHAAYRAVTSAAAYSATWTTSGTVSGGGATAAFRLNPTATHTINPTWNHPGEDITYELPLATEFSDNNVLEVRGNSSLIALQRTYAQATITITGGPTSGSAFAPGPSVTPYKAEVIYNDVQYLIPWNVACDVPRAVYDILIAATYAVTLS